MYLIDVLVEHNLRKVDRNFWYVSKEEVSKGCRVLITFHKQDFVGFVTSVKEISEEEKSKLEEKNKFEILEIKGIVENKPIITEELFELSEILSKRYFYPRIGVLQTMLPPSLKPLSSYTNKPKIRYKKYYVLKSKNFDNLTKLELKTLQKFTIFEKIEFSDVSKSKSLASLIDKGIIEIVEEEVERYKVEKIFNYHDNFVLSDVQKEALNKILNSEKRVQVLHGVTGSGKTEIYIKVIEDVLNKGKNALILVPEIALTPLMISRIASYFDEEIAVLHSSLSPALKYDEYRKIKDGKAKIVIGTRSAIFAPLENIGIIIIDEEHSSTYKQEDDLCYNALEVAQIRAKNHDCKLILGSATPSIETMAKAKSGLYELVTIDVRFDNAELPNTIIVDRSKFENFSYKSSIFSTKLIKEIKDRIEKNEQVILFVNNKGYARSFSCRECGHTFKCPTCGLPLVYHKVDNKLKCHHCDYEITKPDKCPICGSKYLAYNGFGIEKVEEEFSKLFNVPFLSLDGERTPKTLQISTILSKFAKKEANILIGTSMISKGHDFDDVTLVGIINADSLLTYPSYKANENTFNLITQTIGRAGRKSKKGMAVIQTSFVDNPSIKYAVSNDYESFYNYEIKNRKSLGFPPFRNIIRFQFRSMDIDKISKISDEIISFFSYFKLDIKIFEFSKIFKNGRMFIKNLHINYKKIEEISTILEVLNDYFKKLVGIKIIINFNPYDN